MFLRSTKLKALHNPEAQLKVIKNYLRAIKKWEPEAWQTPKKYITLRGAGLWGICFIGAEVTDRVLAQGKFDTTAIFQILKSGPDWDWSNNGSFKGYSGRGGAVQIMEIVISEFQDESGVSIKSLHQKIMNS